MGFFVRKSFRAGPVRLNLSKRGLGASIGVRGARIGMSASGRSYVAAGRGGLYYRRNLGGGSGRRSRRGSPPNEDVVSIETDAGATFAPPQHPVDRHSPPEHLVGTGPNHHLILTILGFPTGVLFALAMFVSVSEAAADDGAMGTVVALGFVIAAFAWPILSVRQILRAMRSRAFSKALAQALQGQSPSEDVSRLRAGTKATTRDVSYHARAAYLESVLDSVSDRNVDDEELVRLSLLEEEFALPEDFVSAARLSAFRAVYLEAIADHVLEDDEEEALRHIRDRLSIPDEELSEELEIVSRLGAIRAIRDGALPTIEPTVKLQRGEVCHFEGEGRLVKLKVLRRFQQDGLKHKLQALTVDKEGTLLVTNKRVLLVHQGTTSIRLDRVLDAEVDLDRNLVSLTKDGAQKPILLTTPDAQLAGAVIATAAGL